MSTFRRRHLTTGRVAGVGALGILLAVTGVVLGQGASAADTRSVTGQHQYTCQIAQSDKPSSKPIMTSTMQLSVQLNVPASVRPGESVRLRGTLSLQFPEELARYAKTLVNTANGYSDTISLAVTMNGKTSVVRADRWQTPNVKVSNPLVVRAPISFPSFTVPAGSHGSVALAMPRDNVVKNPYFAKPSPVAFTAAAQASGALLNANFYLACAGASSTPAFASIPIGASPHAASSKSSGSSGSADGTVPPTSGTGAAPASPTADPTAGPSADPFAPTSSGTTPATTAGGLTQASSFDQGGTGSDQTGIWVPTGLLIALETVICLFALAFAAWCGYRLHVLRSMLDD